MPLERRCLLNGAFAENCWLLLDNDRAEAVLVDPGQDVGLFLAEVAAAAVTLKEIWLTHGHLDHVMGVGQVHDATHAPIRLHPADRFLYDAAPGQAEMWLGVPLDPLPPPDYDLTPGETLDFGGARFTVRHVPGHSPGSVAFVTDGFVLSGDALFAGSVGRVDLPGGNGATLTRSIHDELLSLPDDTVVCPGHGPETSVGHERVTNPFLTGAVRIA